MFFSVLSAAFENLFRFVAQFWDSGLKKARAGSNDKFHNEADSENPQELLNILEAASITNKLSQQEEEHAV